MCGSYVVINIVWDIFSKETGKFRVHDLQNKLNEVYSSTTFATSGFFLVMLCDMENPLRTSDAFLIPLVLAMLTGFLISIAAVAPKAKQEQKAR
ncbi:hypothetical protein CUN64_17575 [Serratia sp. TKO39]|nr:hypothetical protein CUN64_17575 [Serratia sp. TKO39]